MSVASSLSIWPSLIAREGMFHKFWTERGPNGQVGLRRKMTVEEERSDERGAQRSGWP